MTSATLPVYTKKDFQTDQEIRWCPGCGDYAILSAAQAVSQGEADCCIATRSAARAFGLHFIPLVTERYDLVIRRQYAKLPAMQALFDLLNRSALRRKLELLAGYDTTHTGEVLVA